MWQEEDRLAAMQAEALRQALPGNGQATIGMAAAEKLTRALETLWLNLSVRSRYSQLLAAAQHLGLHRAQIPPALLKVTPCVAFCCRHSLGSETLWEGHLLSSCMHSCAVDECTCLAPGYGSDAALCNSSVTLSLDLMEEGSSSTCSCAHSSC